MPKGSWSWMAVIEQHGPMVMIHGAKDAPPNGGLRPLLAKAKELGADQVCWIRSKPDGLVRMEFSV